MEEKKYTEAGTDIDVVKQLNAVYGFSYNDAKALLAQASEVQTVDEIPLKSLKENLEVDSSAYNLNEANEAPGNVKLNRNGPQ